MKRDVLIICACGGRNGFTYAMCSEAGNILIEKGWTPQVVYPMSMDIGHCTGCGSCKDFGECIIDDEMKIIYEAFEEADLVLFITPIHFSGISSVLKTVIDRFQTEWFAPGQGPRYMAAMMSGGDVSPEFRGAMYVFKALAITTGSEWIGDLRIIDTDRKKPSDIKEESEKFVISLIADIKERELK